MQSCSRHSSEEGRFGYKVQARRLILENNRYRIDFEHLEESITPNTRMFILCSPHNPVGRVWTKEELTQVGEFCLKHQLTLFVDEIHGDITAPGVDFVSTLSLNGEIRRNLVVAASPARKNYWSRHISGWRMFTAN